MQFIFKIGKYNNRKQISYLANARNNVVNGLCEIVTTIRQSGLSNFLRCRVGGGLFENTENKVTVFFLTDLVK
ncbi:hypothetical protein BGC33_11470 [Bathymodiolus thermophilus thioautotrophic gill symbiont]|uniref:Uncharacterized protein n=1 Tax=Bathymodiolus thermophilus thioautotrophic gill symbiont TaxID=2360 RepID=A0A1J5UFL1_9GAMM|nr:hypothetical protein BGC33_11470 [Bathymodiolus thermophilus thioautotrophic gill symbiont]